MCAFDAGILKKLGTFQYENRQLYGLMLSNHLRQTYLQLQVHTVSKITCIQINLMTMCQQC